MVTDDMSLEQSLQRYGLSFTDLNSEHGLARVDALFCHFVQQTDQALHTTLCAYRGTDLVLSPSDESAFLIALARQVQSFLVELFALQSQLAQHQQALTSLQPLFLFKQLFVKRQVKKQLHVAMQEGESEICFASLHAKMQQRLSAWEQSTHCEQHSDAPLPLEMRVATWGVALLQSAAADQSVQADLNLLLDWCVAACITPDGRRLTGDWISLQLPKAQDFSALVPGLQPVAADSPQLQSAPENLQPRDGFDLIPSYMSPQEQMDQAHYCILCHGNQGDFCRRGFPQKKSQPTLGFRTNPLQEIMTGCPLEQRISEMHALQQQADTLAALVMIMRDNPMCALTGQRICNDCMQACIYQKQQPVDIPQTETGILLQILSLPWGVELYNLLTLWNPLRRQQWCYAAAIKRRVLVMGLGPAGISLAHHLTMAGCEVVAADGLMIEKLAPQWLAQPIRDFSMLSKPLSERQVVGFGGVAEYGITSRWDKNFLTLLHVNLMRRKRFKIIDAVRFGGQITIEKAWQLGFDHLSIAVGAGLPRELPIKNSLAPGMRQASDFLMTLQLNAAYKLARLVNLQVSLPALVIGGGLTAIDSACELQAYYIIQVEQIAQRYKVLEKHWGSATLQARLAEHCSPMQMQQLLLFLQHAEALGRERLEAQQAGRAVNFIPLIHAWGGVSIVYRRAMSDSPAYRSNHQEVQAALEQGIIYREALQPVEARINSDGQCCALYCQVRQRGADGIWQATEEYLELPATCILVATGAQPNVAYEYEHRGSLQRDGSSYLACDVQGKRVVVSPQTSTLNCKQEQVAAFTNYQLQERRVSFIGDTHPLFHGSVVKAVASAQRIYPQIIAALSAQSASSKDVSQYVTLSDLQLQFSAHLVSITRLNASTLKLVVRAPMAAADFTPGVLYRVQTYAREAQYLGQTSCQAEALPLLAAAVPEDPDCLSFIVRQHSVAERLVSSWQPGQRLALMGPTGARQDKFLRTPGDILLLGDMNAAIYLRTIGPALLESGKKVYLLLELESWDEVFCVEELQRYATRIIWCVRPATAPAKGTLLGQDELQLRDQDQCCNATSLHDWLAQAIDRPEHDLHVMAAHVQQVVSIVSSEVLCMLNKLRQTIRWAPDCEFIAAAYGPMQCMLKGICAQCLQWQIDPQTGERTKAVYACSWHHQPLASLDLQHLAQRQGEYTVLEPLHQLWLDYLQAEHDVSAWS